MSNTDLHIEHRSWSKNSTTDGTTFKNSTGWEGEGLNTILCHAHMLSYGWWIGNERRWDGLKCHSLSCGTSLAMVGGVGMKGGGMG